MQGKEAADVEKKERGGFFLCLLWHALLYLPWSLPAWIALALHFAAGISLTWFWVALGAWFFAILLRTLLVMFARFGFSHRIPVPENKNPYSVKVRDPYAAMRKE
jgi:ABC-type transport system involved in cytochrome bd biosynthesis fused ATPase/permease subunit